MGVTFSNTPTQAYDLLAIVEPSTGAKSVIFTSIPQTHKHLIVQCSLKRNAPGAGARGVTIRLNNATSGYNYVYFNYYPATGGAITSQVTGFGAINVAEAEGGVAYDPNTKGSFYTFTINDYTNTNFFRNMMSHKIHSQVGSPSLQHIGNVLQSTSALTGLSILEPNEGFISGDNVRIYGVKEA
jgi:hypothetical protein